MSRQLFFTTGEITFLIRNKAEITTITTTNRIKSLIEISYPLPTCFVALDSIVSLAGVLIPFPIRSEIIKKAASCQ